MKKILGLDLGVASIGWALVNEAETKDEKSSIIKLGVRVNPLTVDEATNFEKGKSITTNADRTLKRSIRRNLQRYKLRRENLIEILKNYHFISDDTILSESGNNTTFQTYHIRAKAVTKQVTLQQLAQILLMINKKRGYKSSRKAKSQDDGQLIDGMEVAKRLYEENLTPGQLTYILLKEGKKIIPDFYRSDLQKEFDKIWNFQEQFYPTILTDDFRKNIEGKSKQNTAKVFLAIYGLYTAQNKDKEKRLQAIKWRCDALTRALTAEELAFVISDVNAAINDSSGYLGSISDRSKELFFNKQTVGQNLMQQLSINPHTRLKGQVFYRQDYLDEFETIWETQTKFYPEILTAELKAEIRDVIIFYQRKLKSQKGLISFCEFERREVEIIEDGKKKIKINGLRVCPKSSPIFQEFKIWQILNNIQISEAVTDAKRFLVQEEKEVLFDQLNFRKSLTGKEALKLLFKNNKDLLINIENIEGNKTLALLYDAYKKIIEQSGHDCNFQKMKSDEVVDTVKTIFEKLGYNTDILGFDSALDGIAFEQQPLYQLWHLLYSFEGDKSNTGNEKLIQKLSDLYGFEKEHAHILANITFQDDYGSLSTKAIRKILPHMKEGNEYSVACTYAGYRHSKNSLTKEKKDSRVYKDRLDILPRNSLRNPVVEKILNQMVNVINSIIDTYGKPDEIRIELARDLKNSAKERKRITSEINIAATNHIKYKDILKCEFGLTHVSRKDIILYRLYEELKYNGYHTLYSNTYVSKEELFSKKFNIEHIIPQSRLFDDSFSNKTLELMSVNQKKGNDTAFDFIAKEYGEDALKVYQDKVKNLFEKSYMTKCNKLLMAQADIPDNFINRDLKDTQYIAKKAKEMLEKLVRDVVSTTGKITDRLREDWGLVDVMKELNWEKYDKLGLTEIIEDKEGRKIKHIKDWTKRNDHRHHAMDALTIAFTKPSYIQYLNTLNARDNKESQTSEIEREYLRRDKKGKLRFLSPISLTDFRIEAERQLRNILVSIKAKNKVVTLNVNNTKKQGGVNKKKQLTPRGQLHNETIYGSIEIPVVKEEKVGGNFSEGQISKVTNKRYAKVLLSRLEMFDNDPKKAFTGKNTLVKNPIFLDVLQTKSIPEKVKTMNYETVYTIRKPISPDLKLDKVIDKGVRAILEKRLLEYDSDAKKAFVNLEQNPIWLNQDKGIAIKSVSIRAVNNAISLHDKKDKDGYLILDKDGKKQAVDFVNTGNNHHVAIYKDKDGNLQEDVVSFYEATTRANLNLPIVDKFYRQSEGWKFLFTMKQNEYFVFPNSDTGFNPHDIDLTNIDNYADISPNLFRVQKFTNKDYFFRHHLETNVENNNVLYGVTWLRLGLSGLNNIIKVRVNHIGQIVDEME